MNLKALFFGGFAAITFSTAFAVESDTVSKVMQIRQKIHFFESCVLLSYEATNSNITEQKLASLKERYYSAECLANTQKTFEQNVGEILAQKKYLKDFASTNGFNGERIDNIAPKK